MLCALWRFMCLYSYVWYKSTVLTCLYTYEDRIEPQRCTRNVTLPASAVGGGRSREGSSHRAGTWAPVEQNVTSGLFGLPCSRLVEEEALWCRGRMVTHLTPIKALQQWRPEGGRSRSLSPTRQYGRWRATPRRNESLRCGDGYAGEM